MSDDTSNPPPSSALLRTGPMVFNELSAETQPGWYYVFDSPLVGRAALIALYVTPAVLEKHRAESGVRWDEGDTVFVVVPGDPVPKPFRVTASRIADGWQRIDVEPLALVLPQQPEAN